MKETMDFKDKDDIAGAEVLNATYTVWGCSEEKIHECPYFPPDFVFVFPYGLRPGVCDDGLLFVCEYVSAAIAALHA